MPDNHNSTMRNWARRVSIDTAQSAHDPQKALGYAGHVAGHQNCESWFRQLKSGALEYLEPS